jgi:hypothetical protein
MTNIRRHPGKQRKIFSLNALDVFLYLFLVAFIILFFYEFSKRNFPDLLCALHIPIFYFIDLDKIITITVTLIGLIITRNSIAHGMRPYLVYECKITDKSDFNLKKFKHILSIQIKNVGSGVARIRSIKYRMSFDLTLELPSKYQSDFDNIIKTLEIKHLKNRKDYALLEMTNGYALPSKEEKTLFEIPLGRSLENTAFDIKIEFEGFLGDRYSKEIYCIPRRGVSSLHMR